MSNIQDTEPTPINEILASIIEDLKRKAQDKEANNTNDD